MPIMLYLSNILILVLIISCRLASPCDPNIVLILKLILSRSVDADTGITLTAIPACNVLAIAMCNVLAMYLQLQCAMCLQCACYVLAMCLLCACYVLAMCNMLAMCHLCAMCNMQSLLAMCIYRRLDWQRTCATVLPLTYGWEGV